MQSDWGSSFGVEDIFAVRLNRVWMSTDRKAILMTKNIKLLGGALLGAVALLGTAALPASAAQTGDTVTTFSLEGGTLDIVVAGLAALADGSSGATSVTGSLGPVSVTDGRGGTDGWTASAASTAFTSNTGTSSTGVTYASGAVTESGTSTTASSGTVAVGTVAAPVVVATLVSGNNTAGWAPTLTVTLPTSSLAGDYTGTVTTSVA